MIDLAKIDLKTIAAAIAEVVQKETGAAIKVTFRGGGEFTISGTPAAVESARPYFARSTLVDEYHDAELGETFLYYT